MIAEHLAKAEENAVDGAKQVERQRALLVELERDGHDTRLARDLLARLEALQRLHIEDRDRLRAELEKLVG